MSQREAARHFNILRYAVRKIMAVSVPSGCRWKAAVYTSSSVPKQAAKPTFSPTP
jgi:hypothetical protein